MDLVLRDRFTSLWQRYVPGAELPVTFEIGGNTAGAVIAAEATSWKCLVCDLARVRKGTPLVIGERALSCHGAKYFCGYVRDRAPDFRYFLSYGKPGSVAGERYKKTPEIVEMADKYAAHIPVAGRPFVFRRWDMLNDTDSPEVVIFFGRPEVLCGLFTLANFEEVEPNGVICPFSSGCGSVILYPWLEQQKETPKAVLGMFDPSARSCVPVDMLTIAVPMKKFVRMVADMEESFFVTDTWKKVQRKVGLSNKIHTA